MKDEYVLCKIHAGMTPKCSTEYSATGDGGTMSSRCEDPSDELAFERGNSSRATTVSLDWFFVALDSFNSLSLNNGVTDGDAANARILTELVLQQGELNPALPSPAEAISVMMGCTLLMSAEDSPFVEFWNYSSVTLEPGVKQWFNASIQAQQYASGGTQGYQRGFYLVLIAVFLCNIAVFLYFVLNEGLVTDYSEPPNLFGIAINSPPSRVMSGSCGGGPEGRQYTVKWGVQMEGEHLYIADRTRHNAAMSTGARAESRASFADLFKRKRTSSTAVGATGSSKDTPEEVELGGGQTSYEPNASYRGYSAANGEDEESPGTPKLLKGTGHGFNVGRTFSKFSKRTSIL
jgi:hypothetical protein